ncbi:MAG: outer membrane lipoprotein carrier protein LolA [Desulfomonile tiedjei]|nr:outer membrane lipoprotein carrier protein LolA [Desulfomonile tiedjei]
MRRTSPLLLLVLILALAYPGAAENTPLPVHEVVKKVQQLYSRQCCFKAEFDQVTVNVAMDLKDRFKGTMYVKTPGLMALEVTSPEIQRVIIKGRAYSVYLPSEKSVVHGEVPPEMNVEHFFGFLSNIGDLNRNFAIGYPAKSQERDENLWLLELTDRENKQGTYRIVVGVDTRTFVIRRAVIYDALGNYNRFELSNLVFLSFLPDSLFEFSRDTGTAQGKVIPLLPKDDGGK